MEILDSLDLDRDLLPGLAPRFREPPPAFLAADDGVDIGEAKAGPKLEVLRHVIQEPLELPGVPRLISPPSEVHVFLRHRPPPSIRYRVSSL